ncbi:c-type cytochrome biogenesis protein CcmI [Psychrobacter sp. WY6]|uniref:c-type cytochrome biogenesis protein CcmI n=1 Tax=Psychrobacter sp. WY6 TaxID=2708350 RepID=UPI002022BBE8|nr:c-type cytochrome biogenesis protein CcmI [Psychrobacter sp. WY6]
MTKTTMILQASRTKNDHILYCGLIYCSKLTHRPNTRCYYYHALAASITLARKAYGHQLLDINVAVFRERLAELKTDKDNGTIDDSHYQNQKLELERQLLDAQREVTPMVAPGIKSRLIITVWVPVLAAMAYLMVGDRTPVFELWAAEDKVGQVADDLLTGKIDQPPAWAIEDGQQLISAMQTNVYRHADDPDRWMRFQNYSYH